MEMNKEQNIRSVKAELKTLLSKNIQNYLEFYRRINLVMDKIIELDTNIFNDDLTLIKDKFVVSLDETVIFEFSKFDFGYYISKNREHYKFCEVYNKFLITFNLKLFDDLYKLHGSLDCLSMKSNRSIKDIKILLIRLNVITNDEDVDNLKHISEFLYCLFADFVTETHNFIISLID